MVQAFIAHHYGVTGRFDQAPISNDPDNYKPLPSGSTSMEALSIVCEMVQQFIRDPLTSVHEISASNPESRKPWGHPRPWCEYERACLIEEMSALQRRGGLSRRAGDKAIWPYTADVLNEKYGIGRSFSSVRMCWYRQLRERSGIDERGNFRSSDRDFGDSLQVSLNAGGNKKNKRKAKATPKRKAAAKKVKTETHAMSKTTAKAITKPATHGRK